MTEREAGGPFVQDDTSTDRPIGNPFGKIAETSKGALGPWLAGVILVARSQKKLREQIAGWLAVR
jgi:hypothetical protein